MIKIFILAISLLFFSCSLFLKDVESISMLGVLIGLKPPDPPDGDFILSEEPSSIDEGTSKSIRVRLGKKPESDTIVTINSNIPALAANGSGTSTLTFTPTNYSSNQTFTLDALLDNNKDHETGKITLSASGYTTKTWKVTNNDVQGASNWISLFPENMFFPFLYSTVKVQVKLNIKPSEDIIVKIAVIFKENPYSGLDYSTKGMEINSSLTFTPSNYQKPQTAIHIDRSIIFNPDIILNSRTLRMIVSSTTFSAKGDIRITTTSVDEKSAVTTIAGDGTSGLLDATGISAKFNYPQGLATDGKNLYVADYDNNNIRKVVISSGVVTTIAGNPLPDPTGGSVDGIGTNARFYGPTGVTVDATNQILYVADTENSTIRRIDLKTNDVTTIAGAARQKGYVEGTGSIARFNYPSDLVLDGKNLYITDASNNKIRKLDTSNNTVSLVAGSIEGFVNGYSEDAQFNFPYGIDTDGASLYIADSYNHSIRRIDYNSEVSAYYVTTIAGNGTQGYSDGTGSAAQFSQPYRLATDATYIFVADTYNDTIRRIEISTGIVKTIAGRFQFVISGQSLIRVSSVSRDGIGTNAIFNGPCGIISDGSNVYVAEERGNIIRRISEIRF